MPGVTLRQGSIISSQSLLHEFCILMTDPECKLFIGNMSQSLLHEVCILIQEGMKKLERIEKVASWYS